MTSPHRFSSFVLHGEYSRADIYGFFGIPFSQRNRSQIRGLSPALPDDGFCVFVTLNKGDLDPRYGYEDELFRDRFVWVTRRGASEMQPDYVAIRSGAPVSLFVRHGSRDPFRYLGELAYEHSRAFLTAEGEPQQTYWFALLHPVPDAVYEDLLAGTGPEGKRGSVPRSKQHSTPARRAALMDDLRRSYAYVLDRAVQAEPRQQHYQVRLTHFLSTRGITAVCEQEYVDVQFAVAGVTFVGEVKVTLAMSIQEAFRMALGQILEYAHLLFPQPPKMIIFLDRALDQPRVDLAARLGVSVVVEQDGDFRLLQPTMGPTSPGLVHVFAGS